MNIIRNIIQRNFSPGREGYLFIVPHTYGAAGKNLHGWFNNPTAYASAHYSVEKDGTVRQYVEDKDTAWACSNGWANRNSISIEFEDGGNYNDSVRTDILYQKGGELMAMLSEKYFKGEQFKFGHNVKLHKEFANKICPGGLDYNRLISIANNILKSKKVNPKAKALYSILEVQRKEVVEFKNPKDAPVPFYTLNNILDWWFSWGVIEFTRQLFYAGIELPPMYTPEGLLDFYIADVSKREKNIWSYKKPTNTGSGVELTQEEKDLLEASKLAKNYFNS